MASPYKPASNLSGFRRGSHVAGPLKNDVRRQNETRADLSGLSHSVEPEQVIRWNDFTAAGEYAAADWTVTEVGTGSQAVSTTEVNGALLLATGASSANSESLQRTVAPWRAQVTDCPLWWRSRLKIDAAPTTTDLLAGLAITDTTPLDAAGRINFRVTNGSAAIVAEVNDGSTTVTAATGYSIAANTYVELSFIQNAQSVDFYVNGSRACTISTNLPANTAQLKQTFHLKTNAAAARTLTIDSLLTAQARNA